MIRLIAFLSLLATPALAQERCAVLLHGLARTEASFLLMEEALQEEGWRVVRPGYPSTDAPVEVLVEQTLPEAVAACGTAKVDFVTHSMGGILLRQWAEVAGTAQIGRAVMLAPPNQGSEVVEAFLGSETFGWINGPAGLQMGTGKNSLPRRLPGVSFDLGVIAGNRSLNPFFSTLLPGPDDGKVSVEATKVQGMNAQLVLPVTHTFMMNNARVIAQTVSYLETGSFVPGMTWADAVRDLVVCQTSLCGEDDDDQR